LLEADEEVLEILPGIYDRVQAETVAMFTRSREWWKVRRLRQGQPGGQQMRAVIELDGVPEAYALYRLNFEVNHMITETSVEVGEALGTSPVALDAIWRFLLSIDWVARIDAFWLPLDHPLLQWIREPRRMRFAVLEALWVRLVDVGAALSARRLGEGEVVLDVRDEFCPWNTSRWRVGNGSADRTTAPADLTLSVEALASVYLGGFTFEGLRWAGRLEELKPGAVGRADALFGTERLPWCPEIF
jgi:predicted acetyltransferase